MVDRPHLTPEQVAARTFPTSFRGFEQSEVRAFLAAVADDLRAAAKAGELAAADLIAQAEKRSATLLSEAQDEARRVRSSLDSERERAFSEGAARADELIIEAEGVRAGAESQGAAEAERLVSEAKAVRERILGDLARRRATLREQVEQLHAARERLLGALADLRGQVDGAAGELRAALPEAKAAADAAARRVAAEPLPTPEELEAEIDAIRAAGLDLGVAEPEPLLEPSVEGDPGAEVATGAAGAAVDGPAPVPEAETAPTVGANGSAEAAPVVDAPERRSATVRVFRTRRDPTPAIGVAEPELHEVDPAAPFEEVRIVTEESEGDPSEEVVLEAAEAWVPSAPADALVEPEAVAVPDNEAEPESEPAGGAAVHAPPRPEAIDELFARLKAGRDDRKTSASAVLAAPVAGAGSPPDVAVVEAPAAAAESEAAPASEPVAEPEPAPVSEDAAELARRDAALGPPRDALAKRLKRQLADEQNEVLDSLRRGDARPFVIADADDHAAGWSFAAAHDLSGAADIGARFDGGEPAGPLSATEVSVLADELADAYARPLRTKVIEAIDAADGDRDAAADAVRAVYRDRRGRRLEEAVEHAVLDAFSTGALSAAPVGAEFRWVVDDGDDRVRIATTTPLPARSWGACRSPPATGGHRRIPAAAACSCGPAPSRRVPPP